jgi:tetratricopeptide (TPR) repeat protein
VSKHIFISHATADDAFVADLRRMLEGQGLTIWVDSRNLRGGNKLNPAIEQAIQTARQILVVISPQTVNSPWVRQEIKQALAVEQQRQDDGYRVIPLLLPGIQPSALGTWFEEEPLGVPVELSPAGLDAALPALLTALDERMPTDPAPVQDVAAQPVAELLLELRDPDIKTAEGKQRVAAEATLSYLPADENARPVESRRFIFTAPLGPIEAEDLRWYLERYYLLPWGLFQERADRIVADLPQWGQALSAAALSTPAAQPVLTAWQNTPADVARRFSVEVDAELPEGSPAEQQAAARAAASGLLALPWELLHDGGGYLFQGRHAARVRRRLPNRRPMEPAVLALPLRVLLVSPRPEDDHTSFIDHRSSALPLVTAVEHLGSLVELTVLTPPTRPALEQALRQASDAGQPFAVVHFDGHGIYDRKYGLGGLCFEDPRDSAKLHNRRMALVHADELAALLRDFRIPLVFLDACQSAQTEADPTASVAARLLEEGVTSVVAISHSVLVETARRFVEAFYGELACGARVGQAMLAGQQALSADPWRGKLPGVGELQLQDWFVPVLYQEAHDPQLLTQLLPGAVQQLQACARHLALGQVPAPPPHEFQGRSRALLALERLLVTQPYAVLLGQGGAGKTELAAELARWLVRSGRCRRAAFLSLEYTSDPRALLDDLGRQLLPEGDGWSVAHYRDMAAAMQPVARALADQPTLIILDNLESILPDPTGQLNAAAPLDEIFALFQALLTADPATRLLLTSREALPAPFDHAGRRVRLGPLERDAALALVGRVMEQAGWSPPEPDRPGDDPQEVVELVELVHCHARALVLLAREVATRGTRITRENIRHLMAALEQQHPGRRENSLYASVELSLRRLPPEQRAAVPALALFHGGAQLGIMAHVMDVDVDTARSIASALIDVGLGEDMGYLYLRLDPALPPYLLQQLDPTAQERLRTRWAEGMRQLVAFLYEQQFQDAQLAAHLTRLELPNLAALLTWAPAHWSPEVVVGLVGNVEHLLSFLGRPQALAAATRVREAAAERLEEWSHASFAAERATIERLLAAGQLPAAHAAAQELLQRALAAGEAAYASAAYDLALAHFSLGRVLKKGGAAAAALEPLATAEQRFQALADAGDADAARMAAVAISERGDCLTALGRLAEAAAAYEAAITRAEERSDARSVAVNTFQLGSVRMLQERYGEALEIYVAAREQFAALGEPGMVATAWHQIGIVHRQQRQFEPAEHAYRQSLTIKVQQQNRAGEARSLTELGNLYDAWGRLEDAVNCYRQAADIDVELQDRFNEGKDRNNLAATLIRLQRYAEARRELQRAIACKQPYGHAATPWNAWNLLQQIEEADGTPTAAAQARAQAIAAYRAYRRDGGESQMAGAQWCAVVLQTIQQGDIAALNEELTNVLAGDVSPARKVLGAKLQAILGGARDPALAADPALDYRDAVEVELLLEVLNSEF